jgi:phosphotransferase system  glucose/maltose/N-acetylglucosamine-specific IIC component
MSRNQQEFGGKYAPKPKEPLRPFYPIIGLIIAAIAGAIAYFAAPPAYELIRANFLQNATGLPPVDQMELLIGVMIFLVIVMLFGLLFAAFQPRTPKAVTERGLLEEKQEKERERRRAKQRQRTMREKMRKANKDFTDV